MKASSAPWSLNALAMPQAMEWSFATPITRPRFPCISPVVTIPDVLVTEDPTVAAARAASSYWPSRSGSHGVRPRRIVSLKHKTRAAAELILRHPPLANLDLKIDVHRLRGAAAHRDQCAAWLRVRDRHAS
ncbi:hypothetical protein CHELA1G11_14393 [Hyphomicrobiales bacterium]|nr:hypothetical protein CHELA1G11_14393 [Hyphomicrobiales bacterium]